MSERDQIIEMIGEALAPLVDQFGFASPIVSNESGNTEVTFLSTDIGVEVEVDWREVDVYVLIVRLEDGQLPRGYYVSKGKTVRKHLLNIYREQGWEVPSTVPQRQNQLEERFMSQRDLLLSRMSDIMTAGERLFDRGAKPNRN